jgi:hypothetical protein
LTPITAVTVRDADFNVVKVLSADEVPRFEELWTTKTEAGASLEDVGGSHYKLDIESKDSGDRWLYQSTGHVQVLSTKGASVYRIRDPSRFNELIGAERDHDPGILLVQPPDLLIHVKPGVRPQEIETIWTEILGTPSPSGRGHDSIDGVGAVSRSDTKAETRIRVAFRPGTSAERRAEIAEKVLGSPLVARTTDLEPSALGEVRGSYFAPPAEPE